MLKKAISNVRRMASHPTLPYCKFSVFFYNYRLYKSYAKFIHYRIAFGNDDFLNQMSIVFLVILTCMKDRRIKLH